MILLTAAVVLLAAVVAAHLLLTFALVTRLRTLHRDGVGRPARNPNLPGPGLVVPGFSATDVAGIPLSRADLDATVLVAFVTTGCPMCSRLVDDLRAGPLAHRLVAFVEGEPADAATQRVVAALSALGRVVVFDVDDPIVLSFGISSFPTVLRVHAGVVTASGSRLAHLDEPVAAAHA